MKQRFLLIMMTLAVVMLSFSMTITAQETTDTPPPPGDSLRVGQAVRWEGIVSVVNIHGENREFLQYPIITLDDGRIYELDMSIDQAYRLQGLRTSLEGMAISLPSGLNRRGVQVVGIDVTSARALEARTPLTAQQFINVLCRANGDPTPAAPASDPVYADFWTDPVFGMIKYWEDQSYGQFDMTGSVATNRWVELPNNSSFYSSIGISQGFDEMFIAYLNDCVDQLEASGTPNYDFNQFDGVNVFVMANPGAALTGFDFSIGYTALTLTAEGQTRNVKTTFNIPVFHSVDVVGHEMGHTFDLRHTAGILTSQATSQARSPYDSRWSIMSEGNVDTINACQNASDNCLASGMIGYQVDKLGWIDAENKLIIDDATECVTDFELTALRAGVVGSNPLYVEIPLASPVADEFLTLETRFKIVGTNDYNIFASGVVMHQVDLNDQNDNLTVIIDSDGNRNVDDAGATWVPGETFTYNAQNFQVAVTGVTGNGYTVEVGPIGGGIPCIDTSPSNLAVDLSTVPVLPTFTWDENVENPASSYAIYLAPQNNQSNTVIYAENLDAGVICNMGSCSYTPDSAEFDGLDVWGLVDNTYTWYLRHNNTWLADRTFTVDAPAAQIGEPITGEENSGRPTILWGGDDNTFYYQIVIAKVPADGSPAFDLWISDADAGCDADATCEYNPDFDFSTGTYQVWMRAWGPGGLAVDATPIAESAPEWFRGEDLVFPDEPAGLATDISATAADSNTLTVNWTAGDNTTHFLVYVTGQGQVYQSGPQLAADLGCELSGQTCTLDIDDLGFNMQPSMTYDLWIGADGNGGFSTEGVGGSGYVNAQFVFNSEAAPSNLAVDLSATPVFPTFTWDESIESPASSYAIYFAPADDLGDTIVYAQNLSAAVICNTGFCSYTPDPAEFDGLDIWGLVDGTYAWYLNFDDIWLAEETFTVNAPPAQIGEPITSEENNEQPTISWGGDANTLYYQIVIAKVPDDGSPAFDLWISDADAGCDADATCVYNADLTLSAGTYQVWMRAWGPDGLAVDATPAAESAPEWFRGEDLIFPTE